MGAPELGVRTGQQRRQAVRGRYPRVNRRAGSGNANIEMIIIASWLV